MKKWGRVEVEGKALDIEVDDDGMLVSTDQRYRLEQVKFLAPVIPGNFYAAGLNYRAHIEWANKAHGASYKIPEQMDIGYRSNSALIGSGADIVIPRDSTGPVEYEGELVVVIGRRAKNLAERNALGCVAGYTLGNDVSERGWQRSDRTLWRAKNADTFKPMGPLIVSGIDPMNQQIETRINGKIVASYNTRNMLFSISHILSRITAYITLHPGDVIWAGCDGATVPTLRPGDLVEVVNDAIGVLANRVVAE